MVSTFERPNFLAIELTTETAAEIAELLENRANRKFTPEQQKLLDVYDSAVKFVNGLREQFLDFYQALSNQWDLINADENITVIPIIEDLTMFVSWQYITVVKVVEKEVTKRHTDKQS